MCFACSVLIHALPGVALLARHLAPVPPPVLATIGSMSPALAQWAAAWSTAGEGLPESGLLWSLGAPLAFYAAWQLLYWLLVQVNTPPVASRLVPLQKFRWLPRECVKPL